MSDDEREIDGWQFATPGRLVTELLTNRILLPVWIRFGKARHRVTRENVNDVCRGLLLAMEILGREL